MIQRPSGDKNSKEQGPHAMNRENQPLVTDEPVEFEKYLVEVQDFRKITDHFRGIQRIHHKLTKKSRSMQHHVTD